MRQGHILSSRVWIGLKSRLWSDDSVLGKHIFLEMIFISVSVEAENVVHLSLFILRDTNGLLAPVCGNQKLEFSTLRSTLQDQYLLFAHFIQKSRDSKRSFTVKHQRHLWATKIRPDSTKSYQVLNPIEKKKRKYQ